MQLIDMLYYFMGESADTVPVRSANVVFRKIEDETILVPIRNDIGDLGNIFILNEVGAKIWELIDGKNDLEDIRDAVCAEYDIAHREASKDIGGFLKDLESLAAISYMRKREE